MWEYLKTAEKAIVLYGMGNGADKIIKVLEEKGIAFNGVFSSSGFKKNKLFHGLPLESYEELKCRLGEMIVLLCFGTHLPNVMEDIKKIAAKEELYAPDVPVVGGGLFDKAYFEEHKSDYDFVYSSLCDEKSRQTLENTVKYKISGNIDYLFGCEADTDEVYREFLSLGREETFLDLGAYNGDTALDFAARCPCYKEIIAVEPDRKTFKKLISNTQSLNIDCRNVCISSFTGKGEFAMNGGRNSAVGQGQETDFSTVDDLLKGKPVSLIKMDVEGEERAAIKGAENTIRSFKPRMIISAYHRTEDLWEIPKEVLKIRDDYKIYMRHFPSLPAWDTVYYFV